METLQGVGNTCAVMLSELLIFYLAERSKLFDC